MKSNTKKRLIAFMLCMVLVLSSAISAFADEGTVHRVPTDTVELSSEIMKDGVSQGTLFATIPGEAFQSTEENATLQMNLQSETEESTVIENIQNELEARGITEYTIHQTIMGDVSFSVSPEANAQIPEKPIHFRFENTALDTTHAMGFVYDSSNNTTTLYELNENTLQFEEDVEMKTESIVVGCFDVIEKATNKTTEDVTEPENPKAEKNESTPQENNNVQVADTQRTVSITENYGKLTANYSDTTADVGYVWYRSINGADEEQQIPTQYSSTTGTNLGKDISTDGKDLYIALNGGALKYNGNNSVTYKVKAYAKNDLNEYGLPRDGVTALATSSVYNVTGYYEVQNGSFETPIVTDYHQNTNNWQFSNENYKRLDGVWQTTGTHEADTRWSDEEGADIEIVTTTSGTSLKRYDDRDQRYNWHGEEIAAEGNQFAELNCATAGALYQDVLTTPGEVLNYQVAHRARGSNGNDSSEVEYDTMYVVAMSSEQAQNITTQAQVLDVVNNKEKYPGAMVATYRDGDRSWTTHQGTYTVASNQYSTRFFFVAGSTASNIDTVGNFIDNVKFTRDRLTPVAGTANVTVTKTITGLSAAEAETLAKNLSFKVGNVSTLSYNDMTWTYENGVYRGSTIVNIPQDKCGDINIEETGTLDVSGYTRNTSIFVDSTVAGSGITSTNMNIAVGNSRSVEFKNNYSQNGGSGEPVESKMFHEKYIKRNTDGTYDITLNASGTIGSDVKKAFVDIVLVVDTGEFTSIAGDILTLTCSNVTITDTLSQYVDTTANTKIKVNIAQKTANGYTDVAGKGREFTLTDGSLAASDVYEGSDKIATVSYDKDSKTATLKFENDYTFKKDYYYYLSITNVVPNQTAFDEYQKTAYPNKGDKYTDASSDGYSAVETGTSSENAGFYSNNAATISYKWKDSNVTENYRKPVVQVEQITVNKNWVGITDPKNTVLVQLVDKNGNPVSGRILELLHGNNYSGSFTVEEADKYGGVRELKLDGTNGTIDYKGHKYSMIEAEKTTTISGTTYTVTYSKSGNRYTITNTKSAQKIKILKTRHAEGTQDIYLEGAEFTLVDSKGNVVKIGTNTNGTYISDANGLVLEGDITYGTYRLTETKAPSGYTKLANPITVTVNDEGITVSENTNVKVKPTNNTYVITVANDLLYELPHTGGTGIYLYMIGGMLLMFAAVWILYKNKCKEVLEK